MVSATVVMPHAQKDKIARTEHANVTLKTRLQMGPSKAHARMEKYARPVVLAMIPQSMNAYSVPIIAVPMRAVQIQTDLFLASVILGSLVMELRAMMRMSAQLA